jgi:hypothetical protein
MVSLPQCRHGASPALRPDADTNSDSDTVSESVSVSVVLDPHVMAHELVARRHRPQRGHVPTEPAAQRREQALGRRVVERRVLHDLEQFGREF